MIEDGEDGIDELPDSYSVKAAVGVFDKTYNGKGVILISSIFYFIETIGEDFHSEELAGHMHKVDPNESGILDRFVFLRWYVDEEV